MALLDCIIELLLRKQVYLYRVSQLRLSSLISRLFANGFL
jgi:hypothetical protein